MVPPRPLISNRNWNPSCLKWHIVPLKWYSRRKGNGGFQFSRDQFPIAPTLPPALYPCIGTPENWAQQTVVCFNASLHCCVPWSSRKHHIPQQKFKRKTLCNPNREGTKLEKKNMAHLLHLLLNSCDRWGCRFKLRQHLGDFCPGWRIRNKRLRYHVWSPSAPTVLRALARTERWSLIEITHSRREVGDFFALHILESLEKIENASISSISSEMSDPIHDPTAPHPP